MRLVVPERVTIDGLVWEPGEYDIEDPYWAMRLYEHLRARQQAQESAASEPAGGEGQGEGERPRRRRG